MKIHEYQAKEIFARFGIPIPKGDVTSSPEEARQLAVKYEKPVMVKAQVHVGGRGKAGGIKYCAEPDDAYFNSEEILKMEIKGLPVKKILVSEALDIVNEAYVGIILDRVSKKAVVMVSPAGGIDIEQVAKETPEKIMKFEVNPIMGLRGFEATRLGMFVYDDFKLSRQCASIILKLYDVFIHSDASLAEINPLIVDKEGKLIALDAKINLDDNGLYRHPDLEEFRDLGDEVIRHFHGSNPCSAGQKRAAGRRLPHRQGQTNPPLRGCVEPPAAHSSSRKQTSRRPRCCLSTNMSP